MSFTPDNRIKTLEDRYVPVFEVYFCNETGDPPPGPGTPQTDDVAARAAEVTRINGRIVHGGKAPPPQGGKLIPLAGRRGETPDQQRETNDVVSVEFRETIVDGGLATVTIDLFNVCDLATGTYRYTDPPQGQAKPLIDYGTTIALLFGYGTATPVFEGVVTTLDIGFPADGQSMVKITATDKRDRLRAKKGLMPNQFNALSEEGIAAQLVAKMGMTVATRQGQKQKMPDGPVNLTPDQDANAFITDRAKKAQLELSCFGNTIFMLTPGDSLTSVSGPAYTYRQGLSSFTAKIDANGKCTSVKLVAHDPATQKTYTATSNAASLQGTSFAPQGSTMLDIISLQGQGGERQEVVTNYLATSQQEAQNLADGILKANLNASLTASGTLIGDPAVRAGATISIKGVGDRYQGLYYITSATHHFGSDGYTTSFEARRNSAPGTTP